MGSKLQAGEDQREKERKGRENTDTQLEGGPGRLPQSGWGLLHGGNQLQRERCCRPA